MQDIPTLGGVSGGGGGRIFTASGLRGVDRRLQPHNPQNHQPLKCPRCDSQNTKFCYYNNYNLSQPRHFCKSCRRYWTNGGILRNVPVGGGCRKSRRSSTKSKSSADTSASNIYSATDAEKPEVISSSLTTTTTTTTVSISGMAARLDQYQPLIEQHQETLNCQMLPVTNMVSSSPEPGLVDSNQERKNEKEKILGCNTSEMVNMGFLDQHQEVVQVDEMALEQQSSEKNSGLATLDWGNVGTGGDAVNKTGGDGGAEHGLFDVTGVDETYWNQVQWIDDNEQSFNFLPQFQVLDFNLDNK